MRRPRWPYEQVTDVFSISDYAAALDKLRSRTAVKIAMKP